MPAEAQVVGVARPVGAEELLRLRGAFAAPGIAWREGVTAFRGIGEAAVLSAESAGQVLGAAARSPVSTEGHALEPPAPWFIGFAFDAAAPRDGWWESFPPARALVPRLLLATASGRASLTAYQAVGADGAGAARARAEAALRTALLAPAPRPGRPEEPGRVSLREDPAAWEALVGEALQVLRSGMLRKVVLARALEAEAEAALDVARALERAEASAADAVVYAVRGPDGTTFLGASPERLVRVEGRRFTTQALAASAAPEDGARLLANPKEAREHLAVVEDIRIALDPVAERVEVAEVAPVSLSYVTHLDARITGLLREGVAPWKAAVALHPTAAVGGVPRDRARDFLRSHERLARGWYAGAVGWVGAEAVDLRVALRCALVRGRTARLFVGAGLVPGSTARGEWAETRRKAAPMLEALVGEGPWPR